MPNWCNNVVTFQHADPEQINRIIRAGKNGTLLSEFYPCPTALCNTIAGGHTDPEEQNLLMIRERDNQLEYGYKNWFDWCCCEWGTKWDVVVVEEAIDQTSPTSVTMGFDSAWSPPIAWFLKMRAFGFKITAFYVELGVGYCGSFVDGQCEDFDLTQEDVPDSIKDVFPEFFFDDCV